MANKSYRLKAITTALILSAMLPSTPAFAWGDDGHKVVALIAQHYLTPAASQQVTALLSGPALPGHAEDKAEVPNDIASRATWADKYRDSDRSNAATSRYHMTRDWHFVDLEIDVPDIDSACFEHPTPDTPFPGRADNCVVDKIKQFTAVLESPTASHDDKVVALEFLLHFVGDVHQPLHASDHHDQGGNSVKVKYSYVLNGKTRSKTIVLHSYWDTVTVDRLGNSPEEIAASLIKGIPQNPTGVWKETDPSAWAMASFAVAKSKAYALPTAAAGQTITISKSYATSSTNVARKQLQLAGYRLATLLNTAFP